MGSLPLEYPCRAGVKSSKEFRTQFITFDAGKTLMTSWVERSSEASGAIDCAIEADSNGCLKRMNLNSANTWFQGCYRGHLEFFGLIAYPSAMFLRTSWSVPLLSQSDESR
jgi:hypothetical protein